MNESLKDMTVNELARTLERLAMPIVRELITRGYAVSLRAPEDLEPHGTGFLVTRRGGRA